MDRNNNSIASFLTGGKNLDSKKLPTSATEIIKKTLDIQEEILNLNKIDRDELTTIVQL